MGRSVIAGLCVLAAAAGGYAAGRSSGADVDRARATGEQRGKARAATDRRGYDAAFAAARKTAYRQAYRTAYRKARGRK